ncbi:hypothetical protein BOTBODRAFT_177466 [Botryobasidium botryosum FD-172 SS1]|uniref:Core domain-containing protein n=1 Tax=Botryobasidium botryosum (strain FD-172 SS1) TaxID=930990 RepID=A0A067M6L7_BOTB1|nr:hypothetical protein BOTBODRAFT_177466 [Botryobasidium botryosum FD-172 SS1]
MSFALRRRLPLFPRRLAAFAAQPKPKSFAVSLPSRNQLRCARFSSSRPYATTIASASASAPAADQGDANIDAVLISSPSLQEAENDESDVDLVDPSEARIQITNSAAEQLRAISTRENDPNIALRIAVESGGCHGYQYKIDLDSISDSQADYLFSAPHIRPSNVLIDPVSLSLIKGATLDFATELIGSSFRIKENPQAAGGCGCGVSWEAKF